MLNLRTASLVEFSICKISSLQTPIFTNDLENERFPDVFKGIEMEYLVKLG